MQIRRLREVYAVGAFRLICLLTLLIVSYLAFAPNEYTVEISTWDKLNHFVAFLVLAILLDLSYPKTPFHNWKFGSLYIYGVVIELVQWFLPTRDFSVWDIVADTCGLTIYWLLSVSLPHWQKVITDSSR